MDGFRLQQGDDKLRVDGDFPHTGDWMPSFMLVDETLNDVSLERFLGQAKVVVTLLSLDEDAHGGLKLLQETLRHLERWPSLARIVVTVDSPFALRRARREHGLPGVTLLSTLRGRDFHRQYGVMISDYPLAGFTAPALIVGDGKDRVVYAERLADTRDGFDWLAVEVAMSNLFPALPAE
ncbi:thiol peroxidase [Crenobacter cavernae]|uniref:Thiol peroxidase n=1 Tax=Crenobacter cavernae TaxID=2290923 RepID=A0A345Y339_9NEIS|nr:thiol peroxidase [Crenobacter cavernae]AXK38341.1 thiol peroxidase [Crenobacter cavernae]